jgi:inward rectifier potassium channel
MPDQNSRPTPRAQPAAPRRLGQQVRRVGLHIPWRADLYHRTLMLRWWQFLGMGCVIYLAVNVLFAGLYLAQPGSVGGARPGSFADAFFFSVQTIATIGYGQMSPATLYANVLVTIETMAGLVFLALSTGVVFARISRPTARVVFGRVATVAPQDGVPTLSFRIGNERNSQILEADVTVTLLRYERTQEGIAFRRFYTLPLARSHTPVFALTFTVMHHIDPDSPMHGATAASLAAEDAELLISVTGIEETTSQTVHAQHSYLLDEVLFGRRFADIFSTDPDGTRVIDYTRFHETGPA